MSKRRMKRRATQILVIAATVFVVVLIVAGVAIGLKSIKTLKSITLTPTFAETELDVDTDYEFKIKGSPAKANLKSLEYVVDDATATFDKDKESETAILHTGAEGAITVYVKKGKVVSNKITLQVVDQVKKAEEEAAAAAAKEAEAAAAAEAAAQVEEEVNVEPTLVMVTGDNVRMRAEPNTDCDIVRTCKKGETYTKIEVVDDWTKLDYEGRECYIKSEFLKETTQEEADQAKADSANKTEEAKKDEKKDEKKEEQKPEEQKPATADDDAAKKAAEEAAKAAEAEAAKKAAEEAAAAAAAAASAGTVTINCSDGPAQFTKAEYDYFVATWSYTGMADEMMSHHSASELHTLYNNTH
ncbi:MAG: SH3 domain-containing protein [Lachnospiraceae bacterium]|nr:SH3 domain-containing protein [Lachnospiraceae bacterium]